MRVKPRVCAQAATCADVINTKHDFAEPLLFEASIILHASYFAVTGVMKGVWPNAFGVEQLYLADAVVGLDVQYVLTCQPLTAGCWLLTR